MLVENLCTPDDRFLQERIIKLLIFSAVVSINQVNVNNSTFMWALISRRSIYRAGTRFFCRGIDNNVCAID